MRAPVLARTTRTVGSTSLNVSLLVFMMIRLGGWRTVSLLAVLFLMSCWGRCLAGGKPLPAASRVLFETGFEAFEGYHTNLNVAGQNQWVSIGDGGNGLLAEAEGFAGQVAYVGFVGGTNDVLNLFRPVGLSPAGNSLPLIRFSVALEIFDSTTNAPQFDDFRWSAYNSLEQRLFTLEFDNERLKIDYGLDDDQGLKDSGYAFRSGEIYDLTIDLDFARNLWTAAIGNLVVVNAKPITTKGAKLDLNEIDAVWSLRKSGFPGDNFMIFDDYRIVATPLLDIPPTVEPVGLLQNGAFIVRILGEPGVSYSVESTSDFQNWALVGTGVAPSPSGVLEFQDLATQGLSAKFYRSYSIR